MYGLRHMCLGLAIKSIVTPRSIGARASQISASFIRQRQFGTSRYRLAVKSYLLADIGEG